VASHELGESSCITLAMPPQQLSVARLVHSLVVQQEVVHPRQALCPSREAFRVANDAFAQPLGGIRRERCIARGAIR
jgi:hypothetical protein